MGDVGIDDWKQKEYKIRFDGRMESLVREREWKVIGGNVKLFHKNASDCYRLVECVRIGEDNRRIKRFFRQPWRRKFQEISQEEFDKYLLYGRRQERTPGLNETHRNIWLEMKLVKFHHICPVKDKPISIYKIDPRGPGHICSKCGEHDSWTYRRGFKVKCNACGKISRIIDLNLCWRYPYRF